MHRLIRDHLEQVLAAPKHSCSGDARLEEQNRHLSECAACREEIASMRQQAVMLRDLRTDAEPRAGFYARVMERIEAQRPVSIWNTFSDSPFGRRIALVSMALVLLLGVYLVASEPLSSHGSAASHPIQLLIGADQSGLEFSISGPPDRDAVLVNLVTYREQ